ncbi:MAG: stage III sporulation protein AG [Clostridiales bacterium]|nr:stage III sporulation protein AG [Clostridiales bacterium]
MEWKKMLSAEKIKEWKEKILIIVLAGILLLVILLPVEQGDGKAGMWGRETGEQEKEKQQTGAEVEEDRRQDCLIQTEKGAAGEERGAFQPANSYGAESGIQSYTELLEKRLARTLSYMDGVGAVKVMITVEDSGMKIVGKDIPNSRNITTENDSEGGSRSINEYESSETTIYVTDGEGRQLPYIINEKQPEITGIVVVAQGGGNPETVKNITEAIEALFGVEPHKIKVVRMTSLEK